MKNGDRQIVGLFLIAAFVLLSLATSACGTKTVVVTKTVTASPGGEQASSSGGSPSAMQIVAEFKKAGLPIGKTIEYDANTDPNKLLGRPGKYTQKVNWADLRLRPPSSDPYSSGTIEVFGSPDDAKSRKEYIDKLGQATSLLGWYTFLEGNYLLRVAYDFTPDQADVYEKAFGEIVQSGQASPVQQESFASSVSPKPLQVVESGWTLSDGYLEYGIVLRNPNDAYGATSATVDIEMTGPGESVLGVENNYLPWILPGQTVAVSGTADPNGKRPDKVTFSASVNKDYGWVSEGDSQLSDLAPFRTSKVRLSRDELGYWTVTGIVSNPNDEALTSVDVTAIAKSPSGKVLFGMSRIVENLPANGSRAFELHSLGNSSQPVERVDVYVRIYNL